MGLSQHGSIAKGVSQHGSIATGGEKFIVSYQMYICKKLTFNSY